MGAGVALNLAVHEIQRVSGLILHRSSATEEPMKKEVIKWFSTVSICQKKTENSYLNRIRYFNL